MTKEWIPDANLKHLVRKQLNLPDEVLFTRQDMKRLMELTALDDQITILTGLEHPINLKVFVLWKFGSRFISLSNLLKLKFLDLENNQIIDIAPLAGRKNLMALRLWDNRISDIAPLTNLQNLEELQLQNNLIVDMKPITSLKRWQTRCERDPVVYILDLVVAKAFGEAEPDLNSDDVVNIQDLVIVHHSFNLRGGSDLDFD